MFAVQMFILHLHCSAVSTASVGVPETSAIKLVSILLLCCYNNDILDIGTWTDLIKTVFQTLLLPVAVLLGVLTLNCLEN